MSILVYRDKSIAGAAAATLLAAQIIEKPMSALGLDYAEDIAPVYRALGRMTADGLLDWSDASAFALSEYVRTDVDRTVASLMEPLLYERINLKRERRFAPSAEAMDWSVACNEYEDAILHAGGLDLVFLSVGKDGSIAYNIGAPELAPVTHVERTENGRVVTVGMTTVMSAKKVVALLVGSEKAELAERIFNGPVTPQIPATYLLLHANTVFILDEDAAVRI